MSTLDSKSLKDFVAESKTLVRALLVKLEETESKPELASLLADYGNLVDRIMGAAKSLGVKVDKEHGIHMLADYTSICKVVSNKGSEIRDNDELFNVIHAFLFDATEILDILLQKIESPAIEIKKAISSNFIERLKWISGQFRKTFSEKGGDVSSDVDTSLSQDEIDNLMKKLGV
jgi:hypothetical protein